MRVIIDIKFGSKPVRKRIGNINKHQCNFHKHELDVCNEHKLKVHKCFCKRNERRFLKCNTHRPQNPGDLFQREDRAHRRK